MRNPSAFFIPVLLIVTGAPADDRPEAPPRAQPSAEQMGALRDGEVLVWNTDLDRSGGTARVQALFATDARTLWRIIGDCEQNRKFVEGLRECEITRSDETSAVTRQVVKKHWLMPALEYRFETVREPYSWISIRLLGGDLEEMEGSWRFDPLPGGGLLVTHEIRVRPRMPAPRWLVRRALRRDIGDMMACLR